MSKILTREAFENAIRVNGAVGGSTNAVIHLLAIAGRVGVPVIAAGLGRARPRRADDRRPDAVGPLPDGGLLLRRRPAGGDSHARRARAAQPRRDDRQRPDHLGELQGRAELEPRRSSGRSTGRSRRAAASRCCAATSRRHGAVLKPSAASPHLMQHRGRAVVFENIEHYNARIDDPALDVDADCVLVLKNCGPKGYPGMAEVGNMGLPPKVLKTGRHRHGAHLGRAHERHGVRHGRAARLAGGGRRRAAGAGARRRHDRARRRRRAGCTSTSATRSSRSGAPRGSRRRQSCRRAATRSCTSSTCSRRTRAPISTFSSAAAGTRSPGVALEPGVRLPACRAPDQSERTGSS